MDHDQDGKPLVSGAFYWIIIALDVDSDRPWDMEPQPARYEEPDQWFCLGCETTDWPVRWIGKRIDPPT